MKRKPKPQAVKPEASALPWFASQEWSPGGQYRGYDQPAYYGIGNGQEAIARVNVTGLIPHDKARMNASFITRAVNSHSIMLRALIAWRDFDNADNPMTEAELFELQAAALIAAGEEV